MTDETREPAEPGSTPATMASKGPDGPAGLGGWLILPLLGLIVSPFRIVLELAKGVMQGAGEDFKIQDLAGLFLLDRFDLMRIAASDPWSTLLMISGIALSIGALGLAGFEVVCLTLMLRRSRWFPSSIIFLYAIALAYVAIEWIWANTIAKELMDEGDQEDIVKDLIRSAVVASVWIPYFRRSKRVKNTFVR